MRFEVCDKPGVVADISRILGEENVSIASMIQRGKTINGAVPLIMTLHRKRLQFFVRFVPDLFRRFFV